VSPPVCSTSCRDGYDAIAASRPLAGGDALNRETVRPVLVGPSRSAAGPTGTSDREHHLHHVPRHDRPGAMWCQRSIGARSRAPPSTCSTSRPARCDRRVTVALVPWGRPPPGRYMGMLRPRHGLVPIRSGAASRLYRPEIWPLARGRPSESSAASTIRSIRGFRVEPGEVASFPSASAVGDAVVLVAGQEGAAAPDRLRDTGGCVDSHPAAGAARDSGKPPAEYLIPNGFKASTGSRSTPTARSTAPCCRT